MIVLLQRGESRQWRSPQLTLLVLSVLFGVAPATQAQIESKAPEKFIVVLDGEPAAESFLKAKAARSVSGAQAAASSPAAAARAQSAGLAAQHDAFSAQLKA